MCFQKSRCAIAEFGEAAIGVGKRHALFIGSVGDVCKVVQCDMVIAGSPVCIIAAL